MVSSPRPRVLQWSAEVGGEGFCVGGGDHICLPFFLFFYFIFIRNNYNMLLILQLEPFPFQIPHFVYGEVLIQLQGLYLFTFFYFIFMRNNYNMLLIPQLEPFPFQILHFVYGAVLIQLQGLWLIFVYLTPATTFLLVCFMKLKPTFFLFT